MGASTEKHNTRLGHRPPRAGRESPPSPTSGPRPRRRTACSRPRSRPSRSRSARAILSCFSKDEGIRAETTAESARQAAPGVRQRRHDHRGHLVADLDGAAAVVVMSKAKAQELGLRLIAEIARARERGGPGQLLQSQPSNAIQHALKKEGIGVEDLDPHRDQRGLRGGRRAVDEATLGCPRER